METANIDDALALVAEKFRGVTDKDGEPYVMHCLRVMMGTENPNARLVGLMHDLVEDTDVTLDQLREMGFAEEVVQGVGLVTHEDDVSYADYVVRLKPHALAREAKLSDLRDNSSMNRVLYRADRLQRDVKRIQKYVLTYQFLNDRVTEVDYRERMKDLEE